MRIALLSREYPPEVYGGAGVHVEYLARELSHLVEARVHCFGGSRDASEVAGTYSYWDALAGDAPHLAALRTLAVNLEMTRDLSGVDLAHSHTWYANFAGHLSKLTYGIPHIMTSHSLEPLRPWKEEQLGGGYRVSCFVERTAALSADRIVAVSSKMKEDLLAAYPGVIPEKVSVIYNGIDTEEYRPTPSPGALEKYGLDPKLPVAMFVGRITRQKGVVHLLAAAHHFDPEVQLVLCAGAPDTKEIAAEVAEEVEQLKRERQGVVWISEMLPRPEIIALLSSRTVFVCPSIYEPFGIVNAEAMGCGAAVVATGVGGIPEVVVDGETGKLVHYQGDASGNPLDAPALARALAEAVNEVATQENQARRMGEAGRTRAVEKFSWSSIARQTVELYREVLGRA
jgi:starch synthase